MAPDEELKKLIVGTGVQEAVDALPAPLLLNPDDGALVELKQPGPCTSLAVARAS